MGKKKDKRIGRVCCGGESFHNTKRMAVESPW